MSHVEGPGKLWPLPIGVAFGANLAAGQARPLGSDGEWDRELGYPDGPVLFDYSVGAVWPDPAIAGGVRG